MGKVEEICYNNEKLKQNHDSHRTTPKENAGSNETMALR